MGHSQTMPDTPGYNVSMAGQTHLHPSSHQHLQPKTNPGTLPMSSNSRIRWQHYSGELSEHYGGHMVPVFAPQVVQSHLQAPTPLPTWEGTLATHAPASTPSAPAPSVRSTGLTAGVGETTLNCISSNLPSYLGGYRPLLLQHQPP